MLNVKYSFPFFLIAGIEFTSEIFHFNTPNAISKSLVTPILILGFLAYRNYKIDTNDKLFVASLLLSYVGCNLTYHLGEKANSLILISIFFLLATLIQIFVLLKILNNDFNRSTDGLSKYFFILAIPIFVIIFLIPFFDFFDQTIIFLRTLENCFMFSIIFKNKKIHRNILLSFWTWVSMDLIYAFSYHIPQFQFGSKIVIILYNLSNFLFVTGYIKTKRGKFNGLQILKICSNWVFRIKL